MSENNKIDEAQNINNVIKSDNVTKSPKKNKAPVIMLIVSVVLVVGVLVGSVVAGRCVKSNTDFKITTTTQTTTKADTKTTKKSKSKDKSKQKTTKKETTTKVTTTKKSLKYKIVDNNSDVYFITSSRFNTSGIGNVDVFRISINGANNIQCYCYRLNYYEDELNWEESSIDNIQDFRLKVDDNTAKLISTSGDAVLTLKCNGKGEITSFKASCDEDYNIYDGETYADRADDATISDCQDVESISV